MMQTLDRNDVICFGRVMLILAIPIFGLMFAQFQAPPDSWLNAGTGGSVNGQIRGALGKIRPPGPFSFIDGIVAYFGLTAAFVYYGWSKSGVFGRALLLLATLATVLAVPISISRSLLLSVLIVITFGLATSLRSLKATLRIFIPVALTALCLLLLSKTVYLQAFATRWNDSISAGKGTFYANVFERILGTYTEPVARMADAPLLGHGVGAGTLAGARLMTGKVSFLLAESELTRIVLELGPILGSAFILWRLWLALGMVFGGWRKFRQTRDSLSWLIAGATSLNVASGQWGSSTQLGFSVFGAGLALAARNVPLEEELPGLADEEAEIETVTA
jgi:hypothetical protein